MRQREFVIEDSKTLGDSGTEITNIDVQDPISELVLHFNADNGATYNKASPLERCISKIEVTDGSDVLFSLSGTLARGLFAELHGKVPNHYTTEVGSNTPYTSIPIRFGRWLYDPRYALNPKAFRNPQVKITWNLAAVNAVGATGYLTGSLEYSLTARIMEEGETPVGFLMSKSVESFTSAASGDYRSDLPTDYPYRALLVRAYKSGVDIRNSITNVKLSVDGDRYIPFDLSSEDLLYFMLNEHNPLYTRQQVVVDDGGTAETWIAMSLGGNVHSRDTGNVVATNYFSKSQALVYVVDHAGVAKSNAGVFITDSGRGYHNCILIPFGRLDVPEEAFRADLHNSAKLFLTQGNAGAAVDVAVQQYRNY